MYNCDICDFWSLTHSLVLICCRDVVHCGIGWHRSYYYHWARDGAKTMRALQETAPNGTEDETISYMNSYANWVYPTNTHNWFYICHNKNTSHLYICDWRWLKLKRSVILTTLTCALSPSSIFLKAQCSTKAGAAHRTMVLDFEPSHSWFHLPPYPSFLQKKTKPKLLLNVIFLSFFSFLRGSNRLKHRFFNLHWYILCVFGIDLR